MDNDLELKADGLIKLLLETQIEIINIVEGLHNKSLLDFKDLINKNEIIIKNKIKFDFMHNISNKGEIKYKIDFSNKIGE